MKTKNIIFRNLGIKLVAIVLAILVWAMVAGKEHSLFEQSLDINVEYINASSNVDVSSVRPDKVRVVVRGTTKELQKLKAEDFQIKFDLKGITETTRLNYFTEDYLQYPENMKPISIHPRMIEITVKEFLTREVPIRVRYRGNLKPGIILQDRKLVPEKVKIFGYKSEISTIDEVIAAEWIILDNLDRSKVISLPLRKEKDILKFVDNVESVAVHITIENRNENVESANEKQNGKQKDKR